MAVPYTFGSATTSIPLSQLDSNFATTITLGNTAIQLGNTVTTLNNMTLGNVTISGNAVFGGSSQTFLNFYSSSNAAPDTNGSYGLKLSNGQSGSGIKSYGYTTGWTHFSTFYTGNSSVTEIGNISTTTVSTNYNTTSAGQSTGTILQQSGIGFPATQVPSSDANTLDDYEEGTWTPAITRGTTAPTGVTYSQQGGIYIKIGRYVWVSWDLTISSQSTTGSGQNQITGFPFQSDVGSANAGYPVASFRASSGFPNGPTATTVVHGYIDGTTYYCEFDNIGNAGSGSNSQVAGNWNNARCTAWVSYRTSS
jgi:hypothetical protein